MRQLGLPCCLPTLLLQCQTRSKQTGPITIFSVFPNYIRIIISEFAKKLEIKLNSELELNLIKAQCKFNS